MQTSSSGGPAQQQVLWAAAKTAQAAPSIFNTQPWRWQIDGSVLSLYADRERQLLVTDPDGRLLTVSCGTALHHARTALAAAGHDVQVRRMPDPANRDLLAQLRVLGDRPPTAEDRFRHAAIARRRTDRRAFTGQPVSEAACRTLLNAAESQGAHLHLVREEQLGTLALAAVRAGAVQLSDPAYRAELADWTHRPSWSGEGVPVETAVQPTPRRVPLREFAPFGGDTLAAGRETDRGARYVVIFTDADTPLSWLQAGEALSAVLLTAADEGLGTAPISDVTELSVTREELRRLLAGIGYPQVLVRVGHAPAGQPPASPRRSDDDVIPS